MKKVVLLLLVGAVGCHDATAPRGASLPPNAVSASAAAAGTNGFIVTFVDDETDPGAQARALTTAHGGTIRFVYRTALKGFAVTNLSESAAAALERNPRVLRVEPDAVVSVGGTQSPVPSWGLDRIDALSGLNNSYTYPSTGAGATAYIIDTGINASSSDFGNRLVLGPDYVDGGTPDDCHGHGTHVAGTVGGTVYGVAKEVRVVAIRALDCAGNGSYANIIAGVDWVALNHDPVSVLNLSLSGPVSASLNQALATAVASNVVVVAAAGNKSSDACNYSPGAEPSAITVGATDIADNWAGYANFGPCVDVSAPGTSITSDWIGGPTAVNTITGTSMAAPHVAGAAALYRAANPTFNPAQVTTALIGGATVAISGLPAGTPNRLLNIGFVTSTMPPPDAGFSPASCSGGFVCTFTAAATGVTYLWTFSDGGTATTRTATHSYPKKGGNYSVTLLVSSGTTSASSTQTVSCHPKKGCK
jgi:subtilisin family serine protease